MKTVFLLPLACAALLGLAGCGGGSSSSSSSSSSSGGGGTTKTGTLTYVNPTGYQGNCALVLDSASTSSNLILDVVGPAVAGTGMAFAFNVDTTKVKWATSPALTNGGLFPATGTIAQGWVAGSQLQGIVTYKGLSTQVADLSKGVIAKIVLTPVAGATAGTVSLTDAGIGNLMTTNGPSAYTVQFMVGTLTLQ